MLSDLPHPGQSTDAQPGVARDDAGDIELVDIHQVVVRLHVVFHQVQQVRPARDERGIRCPSNDLYRVGRAVRDGVAEGPHRCTSVAASATAATMFW
jgi:hypothetical protein